MAEIRRGIVVMHGVGEQKKGDWIDSVVEPMVAFLSQAVGYTNVRLVARAHRENEGTPSATIYLTNPDGEPERWHIREAWWAQSFTPSNRPTVIMWAFFAFFFFFLATWQNILWRNLRRGLSAIAPRLVSRVPPDNEGKGLWQVPVSGGWYHAADAVIWAVITLAYAVVFAIGFVFILIVYILLMIPLDIIWPAGLQKLLRVLLSFLTSNAADQHAMSNRAFAVSAAANVVAVALQPFLAREGVDEYGPCRTVTVIAHSGGCLVSYEALAGKEVREWLREGAGPQRITWVTVGSGLNLAWRMRAVKHLFDRSFWSRRIDDYVNWINIYARYDLVPQGASPDSKPQDRGSMVAAIAGPPDECRTGEEYGDGAGQQPRIRPYVDLRVANTDLPLSDHGAYWTNTEEVMARIVYAISDDRFGGSGTDWTEGTVGTNTTLGTAIDRATRCQGDERRRRITLLRGGTLIAGGAALALLLLGRGWFTAIREQLPSGVGPAFEDNFRTLIGARPPLGILTWLVDAAIWAVLVVAVILVAQLILYWLAWLRADTASRDSNPVHSGPPNV